MNVVQISHKKHIISVIVLFFFYSLVVATSVAEPEKEVTLSAYDSTIMKGRYIFCTYCVHCHKIASQTMVENSLEGVFDRLPQPADKYFIEFVGDSKLLRELGDQYAQSVHASRKRIYNHKFNQLFSDAEFADLLAYVQYHSR